MIMLLDALGLKESFYFVADNYYASGSMINGLLKQGNHLITRVKLNAVAYDRARTCRRPSSAGRPKLYGTKLHLKQLFEFPKKFITANSPAYGEQNVKIQYWSTTKLLWRPAGKKVMFVAVIHPTRGKILLLSTDLSLDPIKVIRLYALRFKIELSFKNSLHVLGAYPYRFWLKQMTPTKCGDLDVKYQQAIKSKLKAYHCHIQLALIAQGLLQYLSCLHSQYIWQSFGSWLRTIRSNIPPSEMVTSMALRNTLPGFLVDYVQHPNLKKLLLEKVDVERAEGLRMVA